MHTAPAETLLRSAAYHDAYATSWTAMTPPFTAHRAHQVARRAPPRLWEVRRQHGTEPHRFRHGSRGAGVRRSQA
jgi:hypothetical protein